SSLVNAQSSECRIIEQNAVRDIRIFQARSPGYSWIHGAGTDTCSDARTHIEDVGDATAKRQIFVHRVGNISRDCGTLAFYRDGGSHNLDRLRDRAQLQGNFYRAGLIDPYFDLLHGGALEAVL